jgi:hypothetical protein
MSTRSRSVPAQREEVPKDLQGERHGVERQTPWPRWRSSTDLRMKPEGASPFDEMRMFLGGFEPIHDA